MAKKKRKKASENTNSFSVELLGLLLILIGIIGFGFGLFGMLIKKFMMFLAGNWWMIILFALIILGAYMLIKRKMPNFFTSRLIGIYLLFIVILCASHFNFLTEENSVASVINATYNNYLARINTITNEAALNSVGDSSIIIGGGLTGALVVSFLASLFGELGTKIVLWVLAIFSGILISNVTIADIYEKIKNGLSNIPKADEDEEPTSKRKIVVNDDGIVYETDKKIETKEDNNIKEELPIEEVKPIVVSSIDEIKSLSALRKEEHLSNTSNNNDINITNSNNETMPTPKVKEPLIIDNSSNDYKLPSFNLLNPIKVKKDNNMMNEVKQNQETLQRVLKDFGIIADVVEIHIGPAVTEYEITVPAGTKVSRILGINKEIALALGAKDVRIQAPIPGKKAIGIELPNASISAVQIREIFESKASRDLKIDGKIWVCLGKDIMGSAINADISKMPHLLVAGSTGSGKSVCINSMICSVLMRYKPNEVKLVLVDPKKVELSNYNAVPHLLCPVVTNPKKASITLQKIVEEMEKRYQTFADKEIKNIAGYNAWVEKYNMENPDKEISKMPFIVVIIDELADLMMVASKEVEDSIMRITQMARAAGIHLIVATQRPSTDVITGVVKANIPSRISFAVASQIDSRTILDQPGAEKLLGKGDMLYFPMGESVPTRIQGCFISDEEIERLINYVKNECVASYDATFEAIQNMPDNAQAPSGDGFLGNDNADDAMYDEVLEFAVETGKISTSLIQRRFRFGYNRAARMMDLLEERGVVGPQQGSKPREVLIRIDGNEGDTNV